MRRLLPLAGLLLPATAAAGPPPEVLTSARNSADAELVSPEPPDPGSGLTVLGLLQTRAITTNVVPTNPVLDGQIIGILGGTNLTTVLPPNGQLDLDDDGEPDDDQGQSGLVEQRLGMFLTYAPTVFDGELSLTTGFEIDFNWGDRSYGTGGNTGGGIGADQVNLQTRRLHATYKKKWRGHALEVVSGLQFVGGSVYNPATAGPDDLFRSGGGTAIMGSEAAGVAAYGRIHNGWGDIARYKVGAFTLLEQGSARVDDATLVQLSGAIQPAYALWLGVHAWGLRDFTHGTAGTLGSGPSGALSELQGGPRLDFRVGDADVNPVVDADIGWFMGDLGYNHRLDRGPIGFTTLAGVNVGEIYVEDQVDVPIRGWFTDGELRFRYAPGAASIARLGWVATSRDGNGADAYTGVVTANQYGIVGAIYATHGCILLFPDPLAINRMTPVVGDLSNRGQGLRAMTGSLAYSIVPGKLDASVGGGVGRDGDGLDMGREVNGKLTWHPWLFSNLSVQGAKLTGSEVVGLDGKPLPDDPWTFIVSMDNLFF